MTTLAWCRVSLVRHRARTDLGSLSFTDDTTNTAIVTIDNLAHRFGKHVSTTVDSTQTASVLENSAERLQLPGKGLWQLTQTVQRVQVG